MDVSVQLYTVRELASTDMRALLHALADIGYRYVELAGLHGQPPGEVRRMLDECGLSASGAHVGYEDAVTRFDWVLDEYRHFQIPELTVPYLPEAVRSDEHGWRNVSSQLEELARMAAACGITFSYHNHAFEFSQVGNECGFDFLTRETQSLHFQVDVFWVARGGRDPVGAIRALSGRIRSVHLKDLREDGEDVEWGLGSLDHTGILEACRDAGVRTLVLELDNPKMEPLDSVATCLRNLLEMLGSI